MKNPGLELIRGLAAILVVITHLRLLIPELSASHNLALVLISSWGTEAVIVFFMLSGIVLAYSQNGRSKTASTFITNRLIRIVPTTWLSIVLGLMVWKLQFGALPSISLIWGNLLFLGSLQNYIVPILGTNNPLWSLSYEMGFYFLFAFFIIAYNKSYIWAGISAMAIVAVSLFSVDNYLPGSLQHVCSILAYSSIFILGIYTYQLRTYLSSNIYTTLLYLSFAPMLARVQFSSLYYDPLKHLLLGACLIPMFIYTLQRKNRVIPSLPIRYAYLAALPYSILCYLLFYNYNHSTSANVKLYMALPALVLLLIALMALGKKMKMSIGKNAIRNIGLCASFLGRISFSLYLFHYPLIILFFQLTTLSIYAKVPLFILSLSLMIYITEYVLQPRIKILFDSRKRYAIEN